MTVTTETGFRGFSREAIDFLAGLAANNDRAWFTPRKAEFERLLKEPMEALCVALAPELAARDLPLEADPRRSPFRIYRDVRFAADKSPYTTHFSASFPWRGHGRGFSGYFHLQPGRILVGGGLWDVTPARLGAWRTLVLEQPALVHEAIESPDFVRAFGRLWGETVKRLPPGVPADHPDVELLRLRSFGFERHLSDEDAFSTELPAVLADSFAAARTVFELLDRLVAAG